MEAKLGYSPPLPKAQLIFYIYSASALFYFRVPVPHTEGDAHEAAAAARRRRKVCSPPRWLSTHSGLLPALPSPGCNPRNGSSSHFRISSSRPSPGHSHLRPPSSLPPVNSFLHIYCQKVGREASWAVPKTSLRVVFSFT